jgi:hypothetical protein
MDHQRDFAGDDDSPELVRRFVREVLDDWGIDVRAVRDGLFVLVNELVASALRDEAERFTVQLRMNDGVIQVEVQ